jgi:hypothetical protein
MMIDSKRVIQRAKEFDENSGTSIEGAVRYIIDDLEHEQRMKNIVTTSKRMISQGRNQAKKKNAAWKRAWTLAWKRAWTLAWKRAWTLGWNAWEKKNKGEDALPKSLVGECRTAWLKANEAAREHFARFG